MSFENNFGRRGFLNGLGISGFALVPLVRAILSETQAFGAVDTNLRLVIIPLDTGWGGTFSGYDGPTIQETQQKSYFSADANGQLKLADHFAPLEFAKAQMNCFDGFLGTWWGNAHDVSWSDHLTNSGIPDGDSFVNSSSRSIDDLIASDWRTKVIRSSEAGNWGQHMECWIDVNGQIQKAPQARDPRLAYDMLINSLPMAGNQPPTAAPFNKRALLMDFVKDDLGKIKKRIPVEAFDRLQSHLQALESLRTTVDTAVQPTDGEKCFEPTRPTAFFDSNDWADETSKNPTQDQLTQTVRAHFDVIHAGLSCGSHRVAMMSLGNGFTMPRPLDWPWIDTNGVLQYGMQKWANNFHEEITHWNKSDSSVFDRRKAYEASVTYKVDWVAYFVKKLQATVFSDGSNLLDKTLIVLTGEIADGSHNTQLKPMITIGGSKAISVGRYVKTQWSVGAKWMSDAQKNEQNIPQLIRGWGPVVSCRTEGDWWAGVARAMGVNIATFGKPTRSFGPFNLG